MPRRVYIDGVWEDVIAGDPPFRMGQRVRLTRPNGRIEAFVCTQISDSTVFLSSVLVELDLASRFEAALWS